MGAPQGDLSRQRLAASLHRPPYSSQPTPESGHGGAAARDVDALGVPAVGEEVASDLPDVLELRATRSGGLDLSAVRAAARLSRGRPWWLLAIVALVGVGLAAAVFLRGEPQRTDPVGLRVLDPGAPVSAAGTSSPGSTSVVVHLVGRVRRPGLVSLPAGARLAQAVEAAGGLTPGTAVAAVNLARRLVDGEQIAIGVTPPAASAARSGEGSTGAAPDGSTGSTDVVVDLNLATAEQLDALPRVGPATAAKIIDHRSRHGPFSSVDQLLDVPGIGEATLAHLRDRVRV